MRRCSVVLIALLLSSCAAVGASNAFNVGTRTEGSAVIDHVRTTGTGSQTGLKVDLPSGYYNVTALPLYQNKHRTNWMIVRGWRDALGSCELDLSRTLMISSVGRRLALSEHRAFPVRFDGHTTFLNLSGQPSPVEEDTVWPRERWCDGSGLTFDVQVYDWTLKGDIQPNWTVIFERIAK